MKKMAIPRTCCSRLFFIESFIVSSSNPILSLHVTWGKDFYFCYHRLGWDCLSRVIVALFSLKHHLLPHLTMQCDTENYLVPLSIIDGQNILEHLLMLERGRIIQDLSANGMLKVQLCKSINLQTLSPAQMPFERFLKPKT